ncbi:MAG: TlpA family protein disulfide reductase [Cytophagales bacterium]|nr:MAG: TlpA family protein disulfide reductase [Cytophagales bacterium]
MKTNIASWSLAFLLIAQISFAQIKVGDIAPDFTVKDTASNPISLYQTKGKIIILDFWASWCGPCRAANPELVKLYQQYKAQGLEIISISLDNNIELWKKAIIKDKLPWSAHGSDLIGWESMPAMLYSINEVPTSIVMDEEKRVLLRTYDMKVVQKKLKEIFK